LTEPNLINMEKNFSQLNTKENSASGYAGFFKSSILKCSKTMLAFLFTLFFAGNLLATPGADFVTKWNLATTGSGATQLTFSTAISGTVSYSWTEVSPGTASGSGTFTTTGNQTITGLPTGATIRLSISPTNFNRFFVNNAGDKSRLLDVEQWGTTAWSSFQAAFFGCDNLNITATDIPNLANVKNMQDMFQSCYKLSSVPNIGSWDVSEVTNMTSLFFNARMFNENISGWNTGKVFAMQNILSNAYVFNQNLSNWNVSLVNSNGIGLAGNAMNCANYEATLIGWSNSGATGKKINATGANYGANATAARADLVTKGWTITGDNSSTVCNAFITTWDLSIGGNATELKIGTTTSGNVSYTWAVIPSGTSGSGTFTTTGNQTQTISGLPSGKTIRLTINPTNFQTIRMNNGNGGTTPARLTGVQQWGSTAWTSFQHAFFGCTNLNITATGKPNLANVKNMQDMFQSCYKLSTVPNIGSWDVSEVTNMTSLFFNARMFNENISGWNTGKVFAMQNILTNAYVFNQNLSNWNVSLVNSNGIGLAGNAMSCDNYTATLIGWNASGATGKKLQASGLKYAPSLAERASLVSKSWTITGDAGTGSCSAPTVPNQQSPFTIIDFGGFTKNDIVNLEWIVTDENDLSRYDVYSSTDGINFSLCGSVTATMAERGLKTYQFQDLSNKAALVYYRMKAINNDETGEWSSTVAINTNKSVVNKPLKVYPNPATDFINLEFDGIDASNFNVLVMDMSGKVVYKLDGVQTAINQYTLALNGIESGMYIVQLSDKLGNTTINRFSINQ
jgi:surface protein